MFIYIIHFDDVFEHASHYVGSTTDLKRRLRSHATGHGARIISRAMLAGIGWRLGAVYQATAQNGRRVEFELKEKKNAARYCECTTDTPRLHGAVRYPLAEIGFPTVSGSLSKIGAIIARSEISIQHPGFECVSFIEEAMKQSKIELGFIPTNGIHQAIQEKRIITITKDGQDEGFAIYSRNAARTEIKIAQLAISEQHREQGLGSHLARYIAAEEPSSHLVCKVRTDLPANLFWEAVGFRKIRKITHATSGNHLNCYYKAAITSEEGQIQCMKSTKLSEQQ